jgi:hypothetical protein
MVLGFGAAATGVVATGVFDAVTIFTLSVNKVEPGTGRLRFEQFNQFVLCATWSCS